MNRDAFLKHDIDIEDVVKDYQNGLSLNQLIEKYPVSKRTIQRRFKKLNVKMRPFKKQIDIERETPTKHTGQFAKWLRENPNVPLPKSLKKISELTGVPYNVIHTYLQRRKKYSQRFQDQIDLMKYPKPFFTTTEGKHIPKLGIKSWKILVDFNTKKVLFDVLLKIGIRKKIILPLKEVKQLKKETQNETKDSQHLSRN